MHSKRRARRKGAVVAVGAPKRPKLERMAIAAPRPVVDDSWKQVSDLPALPEGTAGEWIEEEEYLTLDLGGGMNEGEIARCADFQLAYLNSTTPFLSIAGRVFQGKNECLIGTELVMQRQDAEGRTDQQSVFAPVASTSARVFFQAVTLKPRVAKTRGSRSGSEGLSDDAASIISVPDAEDSDEPAKLRSKVFSWVNAEHEPKRGAKRGRGRPRGSRARKPDVPDLPRRPRGRPRGSKNKKPRAWGGKARAADGEVPDGPVASGSGTGGFAPPDGVEDFGPTETPMVWEDLAADGADGMEEGGSEDDIPVPSFAVEMAVESAGFSAKSFEDQCANDKVKELVLEELNAAGKEAGFKPLEMLQCVVLTTDEWTPQNGLLTAANKLQREAVMNKYEDHVKKSDP